MQRISTEDVDKVAAALVRDFPAVGASSDRAWSRAPALRIIDCVLSLNRRYDAFVVPRLDRFEQNNPDITSVGALRALIGSHASPAEFLRLTLDYDDPGRAATLTQVVDFALGRIGDCGPDGELVALEAWAHSATPDDQKSLRIPGFGLAGFQYLRMLFGANTTKPDVHIRAYVSAELAKRVSDLSALYVLEAAAQKAGLRLRDADTNIWERKARSARPATLVITLGPELEVALEEAASRQGITREVLALNALHEEFLRTSTSR